MKNTGLKIAFHNDDLAKHFFYVLKCNDNTFYAGYTIDVERRLQEHNDGVGAKYTRLDKRRPAEMIHFESFSTKSEAMKHEHAFKQLTRKQKEIYLAANSFALSLTMADIIT